MRCGVNKTQEWEQYVLPITFYLYYTDIKAICKTKLNTQKLKLEKSGMCRNACFRLKEIIYACF